MHLLVFVAVELHHASVFVKDLWAAGIVTINAICEVVNMLGSESRRTPTFSGNRVEVTATTAPIPMENVRCVAQICLIHSAE